MTVLEEGDLQITIGDAINARKFDDANHGLNNCMKAVDFIVELLDSYLFIEIKDPQAPQTPEQSRNEFLRRLRSGELDEDLKYKYRDSFLYEWASGRANKPVVDSTGFCGVCVVLSGRRQSSCFRANCHGIGTG